MAELSGGMHTCGGYSHREGFIKVPVLAGSHQDKSGVGAASWKTSQCGLATTHKSNEATVAHRELN